MTTEVPILKVLQESFAWDITHTPFTDSRVVDEANKYGVPSWDERNQWTLEHIEIMIDILRESDIHYDFDAFKRRIVLLQQLYKQRETMTTWQFFSGLSDRKSLVRKMDKQELHDLVDDFAEVAIYQAAHNEGMQPNGRDHDLVKAVIADVREEILLGN